MDRHDDRFSSVESLANFPAENPNPVMRVDKGSIAVVYANPAALTVLAKLQSGLGAPAPEAIRSIALQAIEAERTVTSTFSCSPRVYEMICAPIEGAEYCNVYCRDLTTFRLMEAGVRDLARFPSENPNPVIRISRDLTLMYFNQAFTPVANMWGVGLEGGIPEPFAHAVSEAFATGRTRQVELICEGKLFEFDLTPVQGADYCNGYGKDITLRRRAQQLLVKSRDDALDASQMKSRFLANMSHELRTPMNAVLGLNELMLGTRLSATQRQYAESIQHAATSLLYLLNEVLDYSKIEANHMTLNPESFSMRGLMEEVVQPLLLGAERKELDLLCAIEPDVPRHVIGDRHRLRQVLMNLMSNAIKFTDIGEVRVGVHVSGPHRIGFEVADTGIGIPESARATLFSAFTQVDDTGTRRHGGTGLGLTISQKLVHMMGGELSYESTPGSGSTFRFEADLPRGHSEEPVVEPILSTKPVLVAVQGASRRDILCGYLGHWDIPFSVSDSADDIPGRLAAAHERGEPFQALLLDMPDGDIVHRDVGESPEANASTPIIRIVGLRATDPRQGSVDCLLTKPVFPWKLRDALASLASPAMEPAHTPEISQGSFEGLKVLVVDDSELNRFVATEMCKALGISPRVVQDGQQAVAAVLSESWDVVFMDCQMPVLDGYEATRQIRAREPASRRTRIVALTAHVLAHDRDAAIAAGMDDYVEKPVSTTSLRGAIERALAAR